MNFGAPQRFICINVSNATNQSLIQDCTFNLGVLFADSSNEGIGLKVLVQWISSNVQYRLGNLLVMVNFY